MKSFMIILILFLGLPMFSMDSATSMSFSDSYLMRATGTDCIYWNPSNFTLEGNYDKCQIEIAPFNLSFALFNNMISIHRYNSINGDSLSYNDKKGLLDDLKGSINFGASVSSKIFAIAMKNWGISIGFNSMAKMKISEKVLDLILFGNDEDEAYDLSQENNYGLSYFDITVAGSKYYLDDYLKFLQDCNIPKIRVGGGISFLIGMAYGEFSKFDTILESTIDSGTNLDADLTLRQGVGGFGIKGQITFSSVLSEKLSMGLKIDQILGFIKWTGNTKETEYHVTADSVYLSDLDEKFYVNEDTTRAIDDFSSRLPINLHLGTLYKLNEKISFSLDWLQGFEKSVTTSYNPDISLGIEYLIKPSFPIRTGFKFGTSEHPYKTSFGTGYYGKNFEVIISIQTYKHIVPCSYSQGIAYGFTTRYNF